MLRKICPICDHPMKYSHYCSFCKQWISKPNMVNASYYLNESHPATERNCEYHSSAIPGETVGRTTTFPGQSAAGGIPGNQKAKSGSQMMENRKANTGTQTMGNRKPGTGAQSMTSRSGRSMPAGNRGAKGKPPAGNAVMVILVIVIVWILLTGFLPFLLLLF